MRRAVAATIAALAMLTAAPAYAVELSDVEDEVMCVSCNVPLFIAESPQADQQRDVIRGYIAQGLDKDEIKTRLVAEYGEDVLAMPEDDGIGLTAKVVPIVAVLALLIGLALLLPRWRRRRPGMTTAATAGPPVTDAELRRLDEDLKRLG